MIAKLAGIIDSYGEDWVIIDAGGVGYHVSCSAKTLAAMPPVGEPGQIFTEMLVSENAIRLVGFATKAEKDWYKLLESVQGVGTKVGLAILSTLTTAELTNALAVGDKAMVGRATGVGPKLAQRIVTELKDKVPALQGADPALVQMQTDLDAPRPTAVAEAVSALTNLGYNPTQAGVAVSAALSKAGEGATTETLIRHALKELSR